MSTAIRTQRLRKLEKEIRANFEAFYHVGVALKEIRDDRLYKEAGFSAFDEYLTATWEMRRRYADDLISASQYREKLPAPKVSATGAQNGQPMEWTERAVRELGRIETLYKNEYGYEEDDARKQALKDAPKVAKLVLAEVEKGEAKLTSTTVRKAVDAYMEVDDEPSKPTSRRKQEADDEDSTVDLGDLINRYAADVGAMRDELADLPHDLWKRWRKDHRNHVKRLTAAVECLSEFLEE